MDTVSEVINFEGSEHRFKNGKVIGPVSKSLSRGRVLALIGANGSGKTTLLRMAVGLLAVTSGRITILGEEVQHGMMPVSCGAMIESPSFLKNLNGAEVLRLAASGDAIRLARIPKMLTDVGLADASKLKVSAYSQGMRQRLGIARVLLRAPNLILLDEPTNGLDPAGMRWMRQLIGDLANAGNSVVISSHLLHELEAVATDVIVLRSGEVVANFSGHGRIAEFRNLEDLYFKVGRSLK